MRPLLALALVLLVFAPAPAVAATGCDRNVSAPADLQQQLNAAGTGATVCLSGTFGSQNTITPLKNQTIVGGVLKYTGSYNLCWPCGLTDGYNLHAGGITLRNVEVVGWEGKGVLCGPGSTIRSSYLHDNKENGVGCWMNSERWHVNIVKNRVIHNGAPVLEFHVAAGIKLLQVAKPGDPLTAGATITENVSANNFGNGIWLDRSSSGSTISNNITYGNTHFGIRSEKSAGPILIEGNDSYGNLYPGYSVRNSAIVTLRNNTSHGNKPHTYPNVSGLVVSYAGKDVKTWPNLGDLHMGYHPYNIEVFNTRLYKDGVYGCGGVYPKTHCSA